MAITAVYAYFAPDIAELLDDAFERCGIAPSTVGNDHIDSALRSMRLLLNSEWQTLGFRQWMIVRATLPMVQGTSQYTLPAGAIDVYDAVLTRAGRDTPVHRMSRSDQLELPNKTDQGRPDRFFVDRQYNQAVITFWRVPENDTDVITYDYFRQSSTPGNTLQYTLQLPPHTLEAFVSGMAAKLALKHAPDRFTLLQGLYRGPDANRIGGALKAALDEDRERADLVLSVAYPRYGRSR